MANAQCGSKRYKPVKVFAQCGSKRYKQVKAFTQCGSKRYNSVKAFTQCDSKRYNTVMVFARCGLSRLDSVAAWMGEKGDVTWVFAEKPFLRSGLAIRKKLTRRGYINVRTHF